MWEQQSKAILMLNKIIEKKQIKCHLYWPKKEGQKLELPDVGLTVEFLTAENYKNFSKRLFRLVFMNHQRIAIYIEMHFLFILESLMWNRQNRERSCNFIIHRYEEHKFIYLCHYLIFLLFHSGQILGCLALQ